MQFLCQIFTTLGYIICYLINFIVFMHLTYIQKTENIGLNLTKVSKFCLYIQHVCVRNLNTYLRLDFQKLV